MIYLLTRSGMLYVIEPGDHLKVVAANGFGDDTSLFNATPAVSNVLLLVRSESKLYCIGYPPDKTKP